MIKKLYQLNETEQILKNMYLTGAEEVLSHPMTHAQYKNLMREHPEYLDLEPFFEETTKNRNGVTIGDVDDMTGGAGIGMGAHGRYGYPILHNHAYVEMIYVYNGKCVHYVGNNSFPMKEGDLCILAPNAEHTIIANEDDAVILNIFLDNRIFDQAFLQMLKEKYFLADFFRNILYEKSVSPYILFPTGEDEQMRDMISRMYRETRQKEYAYKDALLLYLKQLLIHVIRRYEMCAVVASPIENKQDSYITAVLGYISANYNHVSLKETAEFFNYNETYLSRILKRFTGKTFSTLVTDLQMQHAGEMIEEGTRSLTDIAQAVGCFDSSHFNRKFKSVYGVTPDEFRKKSKIYKQEEK